jgi:hypothetical protein
MGMDNPGRQGNFAGKTRAKTPVKRQVGLDNLDRNLSIQQPILGMPDHCSCTFPYSTSRAIALRKVGKHLFL